MPGVWMNFRGAPWVWNCTIPIGRQCASGLSLLLFSFRSFEQRRAFGLEGQSFLDVLRDVTEPRDRWSWRWLGSRGLAATRAYAHALPDSRKVGLAIGRSRDWPVQIGLSLLRSGEPPARDAGPTAPRGMATQHRSSQHDQP